MSFIESSRQRIPSYQGGGEVDEDEEEREQGEEAPEVTGAVTPRALQAYAREDEDQPLSAEEVKQLRPVAKGQPSEDEPLSAEEVGQLRPVSEPMGRGEAAARVAAGSAPELAASLPGMWAGARAGGLLGTAIGGVPGGIIGGLVGGFGGAMVTGAIGAKVRDALLDMFPSVFGTSQEVKAKQAQAEEEYPYQSTAIQVGEFGVPFGMGKGAQYAARGLAGAVGGGLEALQEYQQGQGF